VTADVDEHGLAAEIRDRSLVAAVVEISLTADVEEE